MKLSVAWIFDHLDADWTSLDSAQLVARFNRTTAEIEHAYPIELEVAHIHGARVVKVDDMRVELHSPELADSCVLAARAGVRVGQWYFIKKQDTTYVWATSLDFGSSKDMVLPSFSMSDAYAQAWRTQFEVRDLIIEIDNKSITHRPDLWGHRGIAREIGALFGIPLKPLAEYTTDVPIKEAAESSMSDGFTVSNKVPGACKRFAGLYIPAIERRPSLLWMAHRLLRIDSRPIDAVVDATNYVMFDLSQPLHAFDAHATMHKTIMPTFAHAGDKLALLDGSTVELTHEDLVISDGHKPLALAGIMGGQATAITDTTTSIIIESACFDPGVIRKVAARHKKRTDASARFEKNLDPLQNVQALGRFVYLMQEAGVLVPDACEIISLGSAPQRREITVHHSFIEKRLGTPINRLFIHQALTSLGFVIKEETVGYYTIFVPTFRATKDITIPEDIVEEVGRMWGYDRIPVALPVQQVQSFDMRALQRLRTLKRLLSSACGMHELSSYPFFDEEFLRVIKWEPQDAVNVQNPVSENWRRLVTTLVPTMCKAVHENYATHSLLRFFQVGRAWSIDQGTLHERNIVSGIFFDKKNRLDFYTIKQELELLFTALDVQITWRSVADTQIPWHMPHQTAVLSRSATFLGYFGAVNPLFFATVAEGNAYFFEFDVDVLTHYIPPIKRYIPLSKYPLAERDISILIPLQYTVDEIIHVIRHAHTSISHVCLVDFFQKPEWQDYRSLTFHFIVQSYDKTLTKEEVDVVCSTVGHLLQHTFNARIR